MLPSLFALPPTTYRSPVRCNERGDHPLRVAVFPEHGRYAVDFDFAALPVSESMRRWLLERFVVATGPSGMYRTERSARSLMSAVRSFATYLGSLDHSPDTPGQLRGTHWDGWVLTTSVGSRKSFCGAVRTLTRGCPDIPAEFFARAARTRVPASATKLPSYTPEEFSIWRPALIVTARSSGLRRHPRRRRAHDGGPDVVRAPRPDEVIAYTNLYWGYQSAPAPDGRSHRDQGRRRRLRRWASGRGGSPPGRAEHAR
jgi:hypothetical protein